MIDISECEEFIKLAYEIDSTTASEALSRMRASGMFSGDDLNVLWQICCGGDVEMTIDVMRFADIQNIVDHVALCEPFSPGEF